MTSGFKHGFIKLDSFCKTYYSGQVILGSVVFELNAPLTFSVLNIEYLGEARFLLPKDIPGQNNAESQSLVKYEGREEYFRVTQRLAGGTGVSSLPAGRREFKFSYQIPHTAPSSFENDITYRINAHLYYSDPYRPRDEITQIFDVVAPLDLNLAGPAIKQPLELVFEEVYGCDCFCGMSPLTIRVRLPASGYCPGQVIPILIDAQNDSNVEISKMIFQLTTKERYRTNAPVAEYMTPEKVLMTVKKGPVIGRSKSNFTCALTVPDMIVPNLTNCRLIDKSYFFKTTIKLSGCNSDLLDESEIYLGLVPLKELVKALNIEYHGEAKVMWTEEQTEEFNGVKSHGLVKYQGHEEYFKITQCLAGGTGVAQLPPGPQEFKFSFQIPHTAPSSFGGDITYHINAYMYYPEPTRPRDEITQVFDVVAPFDLNLGSPAIKQPLDLVFEEVYGCDCICSASPVTIHVRLPASGFCPGQVIPISIEAQNESTVEITEIIFQLVSREAYRSKEPIAEYMPPEKVLVTVKKGPVMSKSKRNFTCEMVVPNMIVPNLENCGIIDISYFFKTTIKLSGCNDDLQDESEIYLGLVPLRELVEGEYVHPMAHSLPNGPIPNPNDIHINPGFMEPSNTPYSTKTQFDAYRNSPTPNNRAPNYVGSTEQIPLITNPKPFTEIGFNVSEAPQQTQYPMANPTVNAPYPSNKWGTQGGYPYPKNPGSQVPGNPGAMPSAPPAYS